MPGKVKVKILSGRNLPVMDRGSDTTDAYVEIKFGSITHKTDVCRKSLNPQWNSDWYRFEVDDAELQDEPLQIRLMDHDTYSANDAIGKVNISLNPLLISTVDSTGATSHLGKGSVMSGWIPVFDTMHGIRGEVNVIVKVDLFSDVNKFRQSSVGVQFFHSPNIPHGYSAQIIHGFVEELVVNDDPEYQWIDKIRTPRASNEARQVVFLKLSGQVQRKIGLKAIDLCANAVIGYTQCFDLEGDVGVVARGIGTAVTLVKIPESSSQNLNDNTVVEERTLKYLDFLTNTDIESNSIFDSQIDTPNIVQDILGIDTNLFNDTDYCNDDEYKKDNISNNYDIEDYQNKKTIGRRLNNLRTKMFSLPLKFTEAIKDKGPKRSKSNLSLQEDNSTGMRMGALLIRSMMVTHIPENEEINEIEKLPQKGILKNSSSSTSTSTSKSETNTDAVDYKTETGNSDPDNLGKIMNQLMDDKDLSKKNNDWIAPDTEPVEKSTVEFLKIFDESRSSLTSSSHSSSSSSSSSNEEEDISCTKNLKMIQQFLNEGQEDEEEGYDIWIKPEIRVTTDSDVEDNSSKQKRKNSIIETMKELAIQKLDKLMSDQSSKHQLRTTPIILNDSNSTLDQISVSILSDVGGSSEMLIPQNSEENICDTIKKEKFERSISDQPILYKQSCSTPSILDEQSLVIGDHKTSVHPSSIKSINRSVSIDQTNSNQTKDTKTKNKNVTIHGSMKEITDKKLSRSISDQPVLNQTSTSTPSIVNEANNDRPNKKQLKQSKNNTRATKTNNYSRNNTIQFAPSLTSLKSNPMFPFLKTNSRSLPYNLSKLNFKLNTRSNKNNNNNVVPLHACSIQNFNRNENSSSPNKIQPQTIAIHHHHNRTDSIGNRGAQQSPLKTGNLIAMAGSAINQSKEQSGNSGTNVGGGIGISGGGGGIFRRSSDSDLSVTPKDKLTYRTRSLSSRRISTKRYTRGYSPFSMLQGNSLTSGDRVSGIMRTGAHLAHMKLPMNQENLDMLEYPFLTISKYPTDFILHIGATVAARSVKLLERVPNPDEPETRDSWWTELRMEIRSHARALGCNVVIGYSEVTTISDEVCVLSATGTAAVINFQYTGDHSTTSLMTSSLDRQEFEYDIKESLKEVKLNGKMKSDNKYELEVEKQPLLTQSAPATASIGGGEKLKDSFAPPYTKLKAQTCTVCHIPYTQSSVPFHINMKKCAICKKGKVPDVILATIEIPDGIQITGRGCLLQAQVCRPKRDLRSEQNAKEISDGLPFLEYELHRLLINKLKVKGMNAIFGLKATVAIGERMIALMATGTAVYLTSLPPAIAPKIVAGNSWSDMEKLGDLQKALNDTFDRNRDIYQLKYNLLAEPIDTNGKYITSDTDDSDEELAEVDLNFGNKDTCILEVDDIEDVEIIASLMERSPPDGFHVVNTQKVPGLIDLEAVRNLQMFTQVWRAKFPMNQCNINFAKHFQRILQSIYYKLRRMTPCAICDLKYRLNFPENDEVQLLITGMALGLGEPRVLKSKRKYNMQTSNKGDDELMFDLDEEITNELAGIPSKLLASNFATNHPIIRNSSPTQQRFNPARVVKHMPVKERYGVDISPLSYIAGGTIEKYLGNLNFFFIRESTSVRENGGISGFVHSFITELLAIVRAHVLALNGNALVAFYMTELILVDNPHKNQGQCIISVGGDVVHVSYRNDD